MGIDLHGAPPPLFKQGATALSRWVLYAALAFFLMVIDGRYKLATPLRQTIAAALYPAQWLVQQPLIWAEQTQGYIDVMEDAHTAKTEAEAKAQKLALRLQRVEQLELENQRLRDLMAYQQSTMPSSMAAQVLYDAADPYSRKVIVNKGLTQGVALGSPVLDERGVLGQVSRVHPLSSEVTLLVDREQSIPVINTRTGLRGVAFGEASPQGSRLELRFTSANADIQVGDLLATSGIDGVYPAGLQVATIEKIDRRADSAFAKIYCTPVARVLGAGAVLVVKPVAVEIPRPIEPADTPRGRKRNG